MAFAVGFCADKRMEAPLHAAASSVLEHAGGPVDFYFMVSDFSQTDCNRLRETLTLRKKPHTVTFLSSEAHMGRLKQLLPLHGAVSPYLRFLLPDLVDCDRILYLDTDTVCHTDVTVLGKLGMHSALAFVECGSADDYPECRFFPSIGLSLDTAAFNSGVMLVDCKRWKDDRWSETLLTFCKEQRCHDQPGLIAVCHGFFTRLPDEMNLHLYPATEPPQTPGVYHFVGSPKPWDVGGRVLHRSYEVYARELRQSAAPRWSSLRIATWKRAYRIKGGYYRVLRFRLKNSLR